MYYHYCSVETFKKIVESKVFWLSDLTESKDREEVSRTFNNLWSVVKERLKNSDLDSEITKKTIEILDHQYEIELLIDKPYGICFCNDSDIMQQWNEYGDKSRGLVLGFDFAWFNELKHQMPHPNSNLINSIGYHKVLYHNTELEDGFYNICYESIKTYGITAWIEAIRGTFKHYSAFIKNPWYFGEYESRIVYYPITDHISNENELRLSGLIEKPYPHYCLPWTRGNGDNALKSIGFGCNCRLTQDDLYTILMEAGLSGEFTIHKSVGSYVIK